MRIKQKPNVSSRYCLIFAVLSLVWLVSTGGADAHMSDGQGSVQQAGRITVTGKIVSDEDGSPLVGVSVYVQELGTGTTTNADGRFTISVPAGTQLTASYLGYNNQDFTAREGEITIRLVSDATEIEEIVMVAYGQQRKVTVTGAVSTIQTKELKQSSSANLSGALAGRLPGLSSIQANGQPGREEFQLYLRGASTTNGANPLILIDGVPRDNISTLDPNEIASISVLKDASATAVFGVRGANGVLLITTRRGTKGKPELNINADYSMQQFLLRTSRVHSWEFAELRNQAIYNTDPTASPEYTDYMIEKYRSGEDPYWYPDRDTFKETFKKWAPQTRVNVNMSGGTDRLDYFLNVGFLTQGSNYRTESKKQLGYNPDYKLDRYNFRANLDYQIIGSLKAFLNLGSYIEKMNTPAIIVHSGYEHLANDLLQLTWRTTPADPGPLTIAGYGVPEGEIIANNGGVGYGRLNRSGYRRETRSNLNASFGLDWGLDFITKGLSTKFMVSYDTKAWSTLQAARFYDEYEFYVAKSESETSGFTTKVDNQNDAVSLAKSFASYFYVNLQYSINYARSFGKHEVTAMALVQRDNWDREAADLPYNMIGVSGRATYAYDYRYLAEFNAGYNGSEQFAPANRFGFFPAASVGWVVSNEEFLRGNRVLTNLKLRASYGKVGNDKIGDNRFLYISEISETGGWIPSLGNGNQISQGRIGNEKIQWEIAKKQNYGVDMQLFRDLSFSADFFVEKRSNILINAGTIPVVQGVPIGNLPKMNRGRITNKGHEFELTYNRMFRPGLLLTVRANYGYNKNKQTDMDEPLLSADYAYRYHNTGYSIGQTWGYIRDFSNGNGYINTQEELDNLPTYEIGAPRIGDFKYVDVNGDGVINDKDMVPVGYSDIPRQVYGATIALEYKGVDLTVLFQGIGKVSRYYTDQGIIESTGAGYFTGYHLNAWTEERYLSGSKISYPALSTVSNSNHVRNDFFTMDRSFLRLKNIEVGYTFPTKWMAKAGVERMRVYFNGQNLYTWKKLRVNSIDPEQSAAMSYPLTKTITFGLNVIF